MQTYIRYSAIALVPLVIVGTVSLLFITKEKAGTLIPTDEIPAEDVSGAIITQTATTASPACATGGCSGQICGEANEVDSIVTTCEYKEEYACLKKHSTCERQPSTGKCAWTQTPELTQCIADAQQQNTNTVR